MNEIKVMIKGLIWVFRSTLFLLMVCTEIVLKWVISLTIQ